MSALLEHLKENSTFNLDYFSGGLQYAQKLTQNVKISKDNVRLKVETTRFNITEHSIELAHR